MDSGMHSDEMSVSDLFERFIEATTMKNVITIHKKILDYADLRPCEFNNFFPRYKRAVTSNRQKKNWKAKALFSKIEKRANHKCYSNTKVTTAPMSNRTSDITAQAETNVLEDSLQSQSSNRIYSNNNALQNYKCLIIGSGPAGLRTAIELQLLGAELVVVVEKRSRFSRNNVLHLWPFVIDDLKSLGAKKFYGKFCAGSIDHISIRQLQLILLKVSLMIGCDFRESCSYIGLCPSSIKQPVKRLDKPMIGQEAESGLCTYSKCQDNKLSELQRLGQESTAGNENVDISQRESQHPKLDYETINSETREGCRSFKEPPHLRGANAHFESDHAHNEKELSSYRWDIVIGADGRRNALKSHFPRKEFRGRLAIAITANFINRQTPVEASVPEISGLSFIYNQDMFNALAYDTNIQLENICYYKDDTHYFVMTAKKKSLIERGVLISDHAATQDLLSDSNVNKEALLKYAKDAAYWTTGLEPLDFALNHYGQEDCAMFDFTSVYAASNACKALRTKDGGLTLVTLVGDSLLEPFWPTGSGCARGFLSSFDAAWMCRQWAVNKCAVLEHHGSTASRASRNRNNSSNQIGTKSTARTYDKMALSVMAERESIYRILAQTTSENLQQNYSHWTLNPHTRYPNLNRHLILPSQVEHLIADASKPPSIDGNLLSPGSEASGSRVKSPNQSKSRRSPKKLKSAGASPMSQPRNAKNRAKSMPKTRSKSRHEVSSTDYYLELEESYRNLDDGEKGGMTQYLNYRRRNSSDLDDLFIPSISGTLPSSHNLSKLEARKARDIDDCLRQRRQKTKITLVRDQLISQMRGEGKRDNNGVPLLTGGNAALFNEIKRMREQQSRGVRGDSKPRDVASGPLSLFNSMRRCASFAERVKSFESKLSSNPNCPDSSDSTAASTPRTPIDNVKNLPQFATLQELFVNSSQKPVDQTGKSRIPVTKLTRDDWNVKCWENRFGGVRLQYLSTSSRSLNKAISVDTGRDQVSKNFKPKKQVDVFQDRINQMANKLKTVTDKQSSHQQHTPAAGVQRATSDRVTPSTTNNAVRSQGWVNHLKRELAKGSESSRKTFNRQPMNPGVPNKPIKKLFPDEDEDDDGIDVNKHYDHLCVNRPTNKYLTKGGYKSHLARTNGVNSKIIDRSKLAAENKQACIAALTSRGSSASSTLSDYSTNTGHSSSEPSGGKQTSVASRAPIMDVECFRCRKFVSTADRITIGTSLLHRVCLTCADCGITLRSNEVQHYIANIAEARAKSGHIPIEQEIKFMCAICQPNIRATLLRKASSDAVSDQEKENNAEELQPRPRRMQSREEFLNSRINYSELYKNILDRPDRGPNVATVTQRKIDHSSGDVGDNDDAGGRATRDKTSLLESDPRPTGPARVSSSPVQVTIPMKLVSDRAGSFSDENDRRFSIAESETGIDGSEQVTLILPSDSATVAPSNSEPDDGTLRSNESSVRRQSERKMMDEEELQRILHLDNHKPSSSLSQSNGDGSSSSSTDEEVVSRDGDEVDSSSLEENNEQAGANALRVGGAQDNSLSRPIRDAADDGTTSDDDSSSLDLLPDSDEYDDDEDNVDMNSTCDDFITTEEFDATSDKEDESTLSEVSSGRRRANNGSRENRNKSAAAAAAAAADLSAS